jgi:hypothetical protein
MSALKKSLLAAALLTGGAASGLSAQNVPIVVSHPVTVGAILRDAGVYVTYTDLTSARGTTRTLVMLEADLAGKVSSMQGVSYQDRTATAELMKEVHMTAGRDFDQTTGAWRGLMGRLDYLIVIDGVDATTANMKLIDVETGSVKGVEKCVGRSSACTTNMTHRIEAAARDRAGANGALAAQRADMMAIKPAWDDAVARYEASRAFWANIQGTISGGGHALRPEIQTLLNGARKDVDTGKFAVQTLDVPTLKTATGTLTDKLDKLDQFK